MDKGTFYTHALARLGDHNDVAGSDEHTACEMFAQHAIAVCLDYSRWAWATTRATITFTNGQAQLPADCLRLQSVSLPTYQILGRTLTSDTGETSATITYTTNVYVDTVTLPDYEPLFCEACILTLAAMMAPRLTNNLNLASALNQQAQLKLREAKLKDARTYDSNDQTPQL